MSAHGEAAATAGAPVDLAERRERKASAHYWCSKWLREIPVKFIGSIPDRALLVAGELGRAADNDTGHCWRTYEQLSVAIGREPGKEPRTAERAVRELVANGLTRRERHGRDRIDFWLLRPPAEAQPWIRERKPKPTRRRRKARRAAVDAQHLDMQRVAAGQLSLDEAIVSDPPLDPPTVADLVRHPVRQLERADPPPDPPTVADPIRHPCRSDPPPVADPYVTTPSTAPSTTPLRTFVRSTEGDDRGEAATAEARKEMEARGLGHVDELLPCASPERILGACEKWDTQPSTGTGALAQMIRDGGVVRRSTSKASSGDERVARDAAWVTDHPRSAELDEAWEPIRSKLLAAVDGAEYWIAPLHLHSADGDELVVGCRASALEWTRDRYGRMIQRIADETPVRFVACRCEPQDALVAAVPPVTSAASAEGLPTPYDSTSDFA